MCLGSRTKLIINLLQRKAIISNKFVFVTPNGKHRHVLDKCNCSTPFSPGFYLSPMTQNNRHQTVVDRAQKLLSSSWDIIQFTLSSMPSPCFSSSTNAYNQVYVSILVKYIYKCSIFYLEHEKSLMISFAGEVQIGLLYGIIFLEHSDRDNKA